MESLVISLIVVVLFAGSVGIATGYLPSEEYGAFEIAFVLAVLVTLFLVYAVIRFLGRRRVDEGGD